MPTALKCNLKYQFNLISLLDEILNLGSLKIKIYVLKLLVLLLALCCLIAVWCYGAKPVNKSQKAAGNVEAMINPMADSILKLSGELLYKVKIKAESKAVEKSLSSLTYAQLLEGLNNDAAKKTFWVNMYNAWYQILAIRLNKTRPKIFTEQLIPVAGLSLSLDDIEHGILRKYRWKWSMGYLPQFLPQKTIKELAVDSIDYRIHFALNCGAKSCPPIAFYRYDKIDQQLDMATVAFIKGETEIDESKKRITTSKISSWFKGDFGGSNGIRALMTKVFKRDFTGYSIQFNDYNWDKDLGNFDE